MTGTDRAVLLLGIVSAIAAVVVVVLKLKG